MAWKDAAFNIAFFGVVMNGVVTAMDVSGYFDTLGVEITTMPHVAYMNEQIKEIEVAQSISETLFASILQIAKVVAAIFDMVYAIPNMFSQFGLDPWLVTLAFGVNTIMWGAAVTYIITGRRF